MGRMKELFRQQQEERPIDEDWELDNQYNEYCQANKDLLIDLEKSNLVFVYGTLRKGFGNHRILASNPFEGKALTKDNYAMYISGLPFVVKDEPVSHIVGEVYQLRDIKDLHRVDQLESHPDFYKRELIHVEIAPPTPNRHYRTVAAWIYFITPSYGEFHPNTLEKSGDYSDHYKNIYWRYWE